LKNFTKFIFLYNFMKKFFKLIEKFGNFLNNLISAIFVKNNEKIGFLIIFKKFLMSIKIIFFCKRF